MERHQLTLYIGNNQTSCFRSLVFRKALDAVNKIVHDSYHRNRIAFLEDEDGMTFLLPKAKSENFCYRPSNFQNKQHCDLFTLQFAIFTSPEEAENWPKMHFGTEHNTETIRNHHQLRTLFIEHHLVDEPYMVFSISGDEYGKKLIDFLNAQLKELYPIYIEIV